MEMVGTLRIVREASFEEVMFWGGDLRGEVTHVSGGRVFQAEGQQV